MAKLGEVCLLKAGKFVSANDISPEYNKDCILVSEETAFVDMLQIIRMMESFR